MARPVTHLHSRFWKKVIKTSGCWEWTGAVDKHGYGQIMKSTPPTLFARAHRVSMEIALGRPLLTSEQVLHKCDNPPCCNPAHLYIGCPADNVRDMDERGRRVRAALKGEDAPSAKLTLQNIRRMKRLRAVGLSFTEIGKLFGVHKATARKAILGITFR